MAPLAAFTLQSCAARSTVARPDPLAAFANLRPSAETVGEPVRWTLAERMRDYGVPGVSIAILDRNEIVFADGFGLRQSGAADAVGPETAFQAASIGKPFAALALMAAVERGEFALDADINTMLQSWRVPENAFTEREKVTLRRILAHTAGLTVHGVDFVARGAPFPSLIQILDGVAPARGEPVRVESTPGAGFRYSGGGYAIAQLLFEETRRESAISVLDRDILARLAMRRSTFGRDPGANVALGHRNGEIIDGGWEDVAVAFAGALWSTPRDLIGAFGQLGRGNGAPIISAATWREMITPQNSPYGLGFEVAGESETLRIEHKGGSAGYRAWVLSYPSRGQGAAVMTNASEGEHILFEIMRGIAMTYQWPDTFTRVIEPVELSEVELQRIAGAYALEEAPEVIVHISLRDRRLFIGESIDGEGTPLIVASRSLLVPQTGPVDVAFSLDGAGPLLSVALSGGTLRAWRVN